MNAFRILLATDEISIIPDYARQWFERVPGFREEPAPVTTGMEASATVHGIMVQPCSGDQLGNTLESRVRLHCIYHAIVIATVRVWSVGKTLARWIESVRRLPDALVMSDRVRARHLPVVIGMPLTMLENARRYDKGFASVAESRWVTVLREENALGETIAHAIADWQIETLLDLECAGYGVSLKETGEVEVSVFFRKPTAETIFFGPAMPGVVTNPSFLRVHKESLGISAALAALEGVLNEVRLLSPEKQEAALQQCLETHSILLTQGLYDTVWPRRYLKNQDPLQSNIYPDFVLLPNPAIKSLVTPKVVEIKTSEQLPVHRRRLTSFLIKALEQLRGRYARYYANVRNREEQERQYGVVLDQPRYALLIGRRLNLADAEVLAQQRAQSEWRDVEIVTYDDLLDAGRAKERLADQISLVLRTAMSAR